MATTHDDTANNIALLAKARKWENVKEQVNRANINQKDQDNCTALWYAAKYGNVEMVDFLLKQGAVSIQNKKGHTPLVAAILQGASEEDYCYHYQREGERSFILPIVKKLVGQGEYIEDIEGAFSCNRDGRPPFWTPLKAAVFQRHSETIELLLNMGANINRSTMGQSPLSLAIRNNEIEIVKLLVEEGADINRRISHWTSYDGKDDQTGSTALFWISYNYDTNIAEYLLKKGGNPNIQDGFLGTTPLFYVKDCDEKMLKLLLDHGADIRINNRWGEDSVDNAVRCEDYAKAKYLIRSIKNETERKSYIQEMLDLKIKQLRKETNKDWRSSDYTIQSLARAILFLNAELKHLKPQPEISDPSRCFFKGKLFSRFRNMFRPEQRRYYSTSAYFSNLPGHPAVSHPHSLSTPIQRKGLYFSKQYSPNLNNMPFSRAFNLAKKGLKK